MRKLLWSDYLDINNDIAIECESESEAMTLLSMLRRKGRKWNTGAKIREWLYTFYPKGDTGACYSSSVYCMATSDCRAMNYTIYKFKEIEFVDDVSETMRNRREVENTLIELRNIEAETESKLNTYKTAIRILESIINEA